MAVRGLRRCAYSRGISEQIDEMQKMQSLPSHCGGFQVENVVSTGTSWGSGVHGEIFAKNRWSSWKVVHHCRDRHRFRGWDVASNKRGKRNPSRWSVVASPNRGSTSDALRAVSCLTASSCVAVGSYLNQAGISRTLIESWNGTKWSVVKSPNESSYGNTLSGINCTSSTYCVAVGDYVESESEDIELTLIETWDGNSWSVAPSANPSSSTDALSSVFCYGPDNCTAVGYALEGSGESEGDRALVETLGSGVWSVIGTPPVGRSATSLQ